MPCRFANAESFGFLDLFTRANGRKKTWIPLFAMQKSQTSVLLRLFAHANGRKKPRMSFFAMQKASPMVLSTFSQ